MACCSSGRSAVNLTSSFMTTSGDVRESFPANKNSGFFIRKARADLHLARRLFYRLSHGTFAGRAERGGEVAAPARRLLLSTTTAATKLGAGEKLSMRQPQSSPGVFSTRRILARSPGANETSKRASE